MSIPHPSHLPPKPVFAGCSETAVKVTWDAQQEKSYRLYYKEFPKEWETADYIEVGKGEGMAIREIEGLAPCSTYSFRLVAIDSETGDVSEPGPQTDIDTQAADCTPKRKNCTIQ